MRQKGKHILRRDTWIGRLEEGALDWELNPGLLGPWADSLVTEQTGLFFNHSLCSVDSDHCSPSALSPPGLTQKYCRSSPSPPAIYLQYSSQGGSIQIYVRACHFPAQNNAVVSHFEGNNSNSIKPDMTFPPQNPFILILFPFNSS